MRVTSKYGQILPVEEVENIPSGSRNFIVINTELVGERAYCEIITSNEILLYREEITPVNTPTPFDTPTKSKEEQDLEAALATKLNKDPQGKYDDCLLEIPFNNQDWEWVDWIIKNMKNKFIRERVELIAKAGYAGYGR